ncbi:MAG: ABC transporter permease [Candidatus Schekmanbacteria bacterium]|nr:ABC transporter permease [Candidatus Schekmanbacteria bacterium]
MVRVILRLAGENLAVFFLATFLIFWIINQAPGDPIDIWHPEPGMSAADRQAIAQELGLQRPLVERYARLLWRTVRLDLGAFDGVPISERLLHGIGVTLLLALSASAVSVAVGVPLGVLGGLERGGPPIRVATMIVYVASLLPVFLLCYLVHLFFLNTVGVLPTPQSVENRATIWKVLTALSMASVLGIGDGTATEILRYVRSEVRRISNSQFIRAARVNGGSVTRHLARNTLVPIATIINLRMLYFLGGAVVVEAIFQLDGLGWLTWQSIDSRNYELLFAVSVVSVIAVCAVNLLNNVTIGLIDPRVRARSG